MPFTTFNSPDAQIPTAADFRTWATGIHNALAALGLVQTADTGQINLTTVAAPTSFYTSMGYEIWRFADALQATNPVFIKIEYGSGNSHAASYGLWVTVGTATDGAGGITTQASTRRQLAEASGTATGVVTHRFAGGTNRLTVMICASLLDNSAKSMMFHIERTKDAAGNDNADGIYVWHGNNAGAQVTPLTSWQVLPFTGGVMAEETAGAPVLVPAVATAVVGTDVGVFPVLPMAGKMLNPLLGLIAYKNVDIAVGSQFSVSMYGVAHNFLALGNAYLGGGSTGGRTNQRGDANVGYAVRWE